MRHLVPQEFFGSAKTSPLDLLSDILSGSIDAGDALLPRAGAAATAMIDDRQIVMIITTSVAVLVGCALVVFLRRSGGKKAVELPKPPVVKVQPEAEADDGKMKLTIFFGTQTGMAEGFAKDEYAADDDEYGEKLKKETLALFFLASYRDGVPTDNAARFYKWFTKEKERGNWLKNLQFGVFGLGNCPYEHFNEVAIC